MKQLRFARMLSVLVCVVLLPLQSWGAGFTMEQVRGYAFPESLVAARKGAVVAWTVNDRGRRNVWVAKSPGFVARQLTSYEADDGQEITSVALTEDGTRLVFVRGGEHSGNWDTGLPVNVLSHPAGTKVEIWSAAVDGGELRRLAEGDNPVIAPDARRVAFIRDGAAWIVPIDGSGEAKKLFSARGRTSALKWSPDGSRLAFVSSREVTAYVGVYTTEQTPILWVAPDVYRDSNPVWSPDGKHIAFVRRAGDGGTPPLALEQQARPWSIWVGAVDTGTAKALWNSGKELRDTVFPGFLDWAADYRIVFTSYAGGWQQLYSLPARGGELLRLTAGDYMVEDVALSVDRRRVVFSANTGDETDDLERRHIFHVPVNRAKVTPLTSGTGIEWSPVVTGDEQLLFMSATAQRPPVPAVLSKGKTRLIAPELVPADFPTNQLVVPKKVTFKAADGVTAHGQLFVPKGTQGKRPAVVYLHGGPQRQMLLGWHMRQYYSNDYALNQYLAQRGFVVLSVNYRLGPGYGFDFHFPPNAGQRGAAEYQDVEAAGVYLQSLPMVDAARVGLYGGSYGGYLTAMALAHDSALFKAGVDIHGVHDWILAFGLKDLFTRKHYEVPADARHALETGWKSSPVSAVSNWRSPVLFITGDDDRNVRVGQTVDLWRRLRNTDVHAETLILVDETHSLHRHANVLRANRATAEFLEKFLSARSSE